MLERHLGDYGAFVGLMASLAGTLLGFLLTALAIITALPDQRFVANLGRTGHGKKLYTELCGAAFVFVLITAASLAYFLVGGDWEANVASLVGAYFALGLLVMASAGYKFYQVLTATSGMTGSAAP